MNNQGEGKTNSAEDMFFIDVSKKQQGVILGKLQDSVALGDCDCSCTLSCDCDCSCR